MCIRDSVDTVEAGATPDEARAWWVSYINGKANEAGIDLDALGVAPRTLLAWWSWSRTAS